MIGNRIINTVFKTTGFQNFAFSTVTKKKQMELTIRTPYKTILTNFSGFSRIITKTQQSQLVVQNRTPAALHILPPGFLKIKLNQEVKGTSGDYLHTGGWMIVHADNSCEVNLMDIVEKSQVRADQIGKGQVKENDSLAGKYISKARKNASKIFLKRALV